MTKPTPKTFAAVLGALRYGELSDELDAELSKLTHECATTGRPGSLTLTIKLKPGKGRHFAITDEVKVKLPKADRGETLMFPTPEGFLSRNDPKQLAIEGLTVVDTSTGEILDVTRKAG